MERRTVDWIVEMSIAAGRGEVEAADASREGEEELIVALIMCEIGGRGTLLLMMSAQCLA
jgi:hypothetical protein